MTIIVVEGVDGAGKSTLIRNLRQISKQYFWTLNASGPPTSTEEVTRAIDALGNLTESAPTVNWVFDRHPLVSEPIYGRILRGKSYLDDISPKVYRDLIGYFDKIIYCRPPFATVEEESRRESQLSGVHTHLRELYDAYDEAIDFLHVHLWVPVIWYDWMDALDSSDPGHDINELFWVRRS